VEGHISRFKALLSRGVGAGQVKGIKSGIGPGRNIGPNSETFLWDW